MKLGIVIRGHSSVNHLQATLCSIFEQDVSGIAVSVYLDKDIQLTVRKEIFTSLGNFNILRVVNAPYSGNTFVYLQALWDMFQIDGCDTVLVLEEGCVLSTNSIRYIQSLEMIATIYTLYTTDDKKNSWLQDFVLPGFLISKSSFEYFAKWFDTGLYLAHIWYPSEISEDRKRLWESELNPVINMFEQLMQVFLKVQGGICKFPDQSYIYTLT